MSETVFILYLITNLGPPLHIEKREVVAVYASHERCELASASQRGGLTEYMRLECVSEKIQK
jgi:hypothetical protein